MNHVFHDFMKVYMFSWIKCMNSCITFMGLWICIHVYDEWSWSIKNSFVRTVKFVFRLPVQPRVYLPRSQSRCDLSRPVVFAGKSDRDLRTRDLEVLSTGTGKRSAAVPLEMATEPRASRKRTELQEEDRVAVGEPSAGGGPGGRRRTERQE